MTQHYFNPNFREQEITRSGPYVFKFGVITVDDPAKKTVGPILTNFYGCKEITAKQAAAHLKKAAADSQEAQAATEEAERQEAEAKSSETKPEDNM